MASDLKQHPIFNGLEVSSASMAAATPTNIRRRTESTDARREQLIQAAIKSISKRGITATTISDVAGEAGLSQGIVNLHFKSKENLFVETLRHLADEYCCYWESAVQDAGKSPAEKIAAMVDLDFSKKVCEPKKLSVWFAYWGAAKSRPTYRKLCLDVDQHYDSVLISHFEQLAGEGGYSNIRADKAGQCLSAMISGFWLDILISPEVMDRQRAHAICMDYLATIFPKHF